MSSNRADRSLQVTIAALSGHATLDEQSAGRDLAAIVDGSQLEVVAALLRSALGSFEP
jgi:hypothetical protein